MTVYAHYDNETKEVLGWYLDRFVSTPPQPYIPVTNEEHQVFIEILSDSSKVAKVEDGKVVIKRRVITIPWSAVRAKRDRLLSETDYTQMPDYVHEHKEAYRLYRQALRDLPQKYANRDPKEIVWPKLEDYIK